MQPLENSTIHSWEDESEKGKTGQSIFMKVVLTSQISRGPWTMLWELLVVIKDLTYMKWLE